MPKHKRPKGWSPSGDIWISLRTRERDEAKKQCALITAEITNVARALRQTTAAVSTPPTYLDNEQRWAIAGEVYRAWIDEHRREPGESEYWQELQAIWQSAAEESDGLERLVGQSLDFYLSRRHGIGRLDQHTRAKLLTAVRDTQLLAFERISRNADGDYSPDANLARFPSVIKIGDTPHRAGLKTKVSFGDLIKSWAQSSRLGRCGCPPRATLR